MKKGEVTMMEQFNAIVNIIINNGIAVGVVIYFLYRDNKYNENTIVLLNSIKEIVERLDEMTRKEVKKHEDQ